MPRMNPDNSIAAYGVVNFSGEAQIVALPQGGRDRLSGRDVGAEVELAGFEVVLVDVSGPGASNKSGSSLDAPNPA